MPDVTKARDPKFPKHGYTKKPLVKVYSKKSGGKKIANLFIGEWLKILDDEQKLTRRYFIKDKT